MYLIVTNSPTRPATELRVARKEYLFTKQNTALQCHVGTLSDNKVTTKAPLNIMSTKYMNRE